MINDRSLRTQLPRLVVSVLFFVAGACASSPPPAAAPPPVAPAPPAAEPAPEPPAEAAPPAASEEAAPAPQPECQTSDDCKARGEAPSGMQWSCNAGACASEAVPEPAKTEEPAAPAKPGKAKKGG